VAGAVIWKVSVLPLKVIGLLKVKVAVFAEAAILMVPMLEPFCNIVAVQLPAGATKHPAVDPVKLTGKVKL
jgi:hypothetical protein